MTRILLIFSFLMMFVPAHAGENCTCRYDGNDIAEGSTICMTTPRGKQLARCDRILNNPSWKFLGEGCPVS